MSASPSRSSASLRNEKKRVNPLFFGLTLAHISMLLIPQGGLGRVNPSKKDSGLARWGLNLEPETMRVDVTNGRRNGLNIGRKVGPCPGSRRRWVLGSVHAVASRSCHKHIPSQVSG